MSSKSRVRPGNPIFAELRAQAELQLRQNGVDDGVRLHGGPMDGWYVRRDADALEPDWYMTCPPEVREDFPPGRYQLSDSGKYAQWAVVESSEAT